MDPNYTLTQLTVDFMRLRRQVNGLQGDMARLTGRSRIRTFASQSTQTETNQAASSSRGQQQQQSQISRPQFGDGCPDTIYSTFPEHSDADHINFTSSLPVNRPQDLSTLPPFPRVIRRPQSDTDSDDDDYETEFANDDDSVDLSIPDWLFVDNLHEVDPIDTPKVAESRAGSSKTTKKVTFGNDHGLESSTSSICTERHPCTLGTPERVRFDLPRDPGAIQMYANSTTAIPHHEVYPNIKIGVTASGQRGTSTAKFLLSKFSTGRQLHDKVRSHFGISPDQELNLAFMRYEMIKPNETEIWNYGMRYFPTFVAQVPDEYQRGDLMEIQYLGKGPNINGDPLQVIYDRPSANKRK